MVGNQRTLHRIIVPGPLADDVASQAIGRRPQGGDAFGDLVDHLRDTCVLRVQHQMHANEIRPDHVPVDVSLGYVSAEEEVAIVAAQGRAHPLDALRPVITPDEVRTLRSAVKAVRMSDEITRYAVDLARATRGAAGVQLGAGPRASLALTRVAQALALVDGMEYVTPDHVRALAQPVLAHRLALDPQAKFSGLSAAGVVAEILARLPVPA